MPLRLIVFGGRHYADREHVYHALDFLLATRGISLIIQGGAPGADELARQWAISRGVGYQTVGAEWERYGKAAGPMRNEQMAQMKVDGAVMFAGGRGTVDMRRACERHGIPVWEPPVKSK